MVCALAALALNAPTHAQCAGDINGDGQIDGHDLSILLSNWGLCPPTLTSVTPLHGSTLGGTVLTIDGAWFGGTVEVTVGGVPCTGVELVTPTQLRATTPPGAAGQAPIAVTAIGGTSLSPQPFTYVEQQIQSIVPSSGPYGGGTQITITGQYLAGTTSVTAGGVPCTNVVVVSGTQITAVTPAGLIGAVDVVVTGAKGVVTVARGFTYSNAMVPSWATLIEPVPDPAVVTDASLRVAISSTGLAWRVRDTATQIEMVLIPPGTFQMGCSASQQWDCSYSESPVHTVTLTNAFYMGRYEVTQAQWQARMGSNPSYFQSASEEVPADQVPNRPVESVSWNITQGFMTQTGMRLPTEAEWEYACRAGTTTAFHGFTGYLSGTNDDSLLGNIAWYTSNSNNQTRPVGGKLGNGYGLHDMSGNALEWVNDRFGPYPAEPQVDPSGPGIGYYPAVRGGDWGNNSYYSRASWRYNVPADSTAYRVGFRAARTP